MVHKRIFRVRFLNDTTIIRSSINTYFRIKIRKEVDIDHDLVLYKEGFFGAPSRHTDLYTVPIMSTSGLFVLELKISDFTVNVYI